MIDLPLDIEDRAAYPLVAQDERWIFNKLILAEKLGYVCGPCGTDVTIEGDYIVRPVMNAAGEGKGGFAKHTFAAPELEQPPYAAGYFWSEFFDDTVDEHGFTAYTNDLPVDEWSGTRTGRDLPGVWRTTNYRAPALPAFLQGLSTHLLVEWIGDKIIEVSPRHMGYLNGRVDVEMRAFQVSPPWGNDDDERWFYWRQRAI